MLPDASPPLPVAKQSPVVPGSFQPWRRRINSSIMKRIINMTPKILQVWFGWQPSQGQPRMLVTVGGKTLRLADKGAAVMDFNREGRDGFPMKARWVGLILESLGAALGDTLVLQHTYTDSSGVMHVTASLERAPLREGSASDAQLTAQAWSASSATYNYTRGLNDHFPSLSACSDARWQQAENDEVQQPTSAAKRRRELEAAAAPEVLRCPYCQRTYRYEGPFNKHVHSCELKAMAVFGHKSQQHPPEVGRGGGSVPCSPQSLNDSDVAATLIGLGNTSGPPANQLPEQPLAQQEEQQKQKRQQQAAADVGGLQQQTAMDTGAADRDKEQSSESPGLASRQPAAAGKTVPKAEAEAAAAAHCGKQPGGSIAQEAAVTQQEAAPSLPPAQQQHAPAPASASAFAKETLPMPPPQQQQAPAPAPAEAQLPRNRTLRRQFLARQVAPADIEAYLLWWDSLSVPAKLVEWRNVLDDLLRDPLSEELREHVQDMASLAPRLGS